MIKTVLILTITGVLTISINAQQFGFGCLGLVGFYGGIEVQQYKPNDLNEYVRSYNDINKLSLQDEMGEFGRAVGYRIGFNVVRASVSGFVFTVKGYYSTLSETKSATEIVSTGLSNRSLRMRMNSFGAGIDFGTKIIGGLSWKVVDAEAQFATLHLRETVSIPDGATTVQEFGNDDRTITFIIGSGFILNILSNYLTLEGTVGYTFASMGKLKNSETNGYFPETVSGNIPLEKSINEGGVNMSMQINLGFPF